MFTPAFAEFGTTTNFSFLRGASHPEELVAQAHALGLSGIGIADRNTFAGVVRAYSYAKTLETRDHPFRVVTGTRLVFADGTPDILAYPIDRDAYSRLTRLLTLGNSRSIKGSCTLFLNDFLNDAAGLQLIVMDGSSAEEPNGAPAKIWPQLAADIASAEGKESAAILPLPDRPQRRAEQDFPSAGDVVLFRRKAASEPSDLFEALREAGAKLWIGAAFTYGPAAQARLQRRAALAKAARLPLLATNDATMHTPERRPLSDVLTCIRHGVTLEEAGFRLAANAERHLKDGKEMARLFHDLPEALDETIRFLDGITFSLKQLEFNYPRELREGFDSPQEALEHFARKGAKWRYPDGVPEQVTKALKHELALIEELKYPAYFLTVYDIVRFARKKGILCQGRGSAANSTLCFCLGITEANPIFHDLLFERFISASRKEPPDIDVDFEHQRREEVMQYIYDHYGRLRAGLTATVVTYRTRSALREVGKAFGLSEDTVSTLAGTVWGYWSKEIDKKEARRVGLDPDEDRMAAVLKLAEELVGFPRHLSQHTGGFVITDTRLDEVVPIANAAMEKRTTVEWDKDDLDAVGMLKVDVLALGMLSCMKRGFNLLNAHYGKDLTIAKIPTEDPRVYAMIQRADTLGVFQIESRAQMSMLPRLRPEKFYDLVIEVAIVRPGPIQGDMVHPYLRRRQKLEPTTYPMAELEPVLHKTLGVPLFQEQAMKIAMVAADFTPDEADQLRRAMATFKKVGTIGTFGEKMISRMVAKKYPRDFAERCFKQIEGFGSYGFPESHAASFALLVYASSWLKCRYPDVFCCAMLNSQPMGFYAPAQLVRDAREHGVEVRAVDINASTWDCTLEPGGHGQIHIRHDDMRADIAGTHAVRLGLRQVKGLREEDMKRLTEARAGGYDSVRDLWLRTGLAPKTLERLAEADAFRSLGLDRRTALWAIRGLNRSGDKDDLPLFTARALGEHEAEAALPPMRLGEHVVEDYRHLSLSLKAHPVAFLRPDLAARRILPSQDLSQTRPGSRVTVAGLVLVRQRPGSASGVIFMTIEDETGIANIIVWPKVFERQRPAVIAARLVAVTGRLQREAEVIHVVAETFTDLSGLLGQLSDRGPELSDLARADEVKRPQTFSAQKRDYGKELAAKIGFPLAADTRGARQVAGVMPKGRNFH